MDADRGEEGVKRFRKWFSEGLQVYWLGVLFSQIMSKIVGNPPWTGIIVSAQVLFIYYTVDFFFDFDLKIHRKFDDPEEREG